MAKTELQKISDDISKYKPAEDVQPGEVEHTESQGESVRGPGSQPARGAERQVHLDGHRNDQRLRAGRRVNERLRRSRSHSRATREIPRDRAL